MRTKPCLTLADVKTMIAACEAEAAKNKWAVAISAMTKRPSKFFEDRVKERPAFAGFPAGILIQGGMPVMHQNECVGAIGVSGVQSHEDEQIAQAGASALA
jgi:glc operon protein GlcG